MRPSITWLLFAAPFGAMAAVKPSSIAPSLSSSPLPSSTPSPCPYTPIKNCQPFTGTFGQTCAPINGECQNGYRVLCGKRPKDSEPLIAQYPKVASWDACVKICDSNPECGGVGYTNRYCLLYHPKVALVEDTTRNFVQRVCEKSS